ncbi:MAG: acetylornithine deacetylase [Albidovulum sp.]|nr:acetylornithine deacetylase [Albidovulum sp.]
MNSLEILEKLVAFPVIAGMPNLEIIGFVQHELRRFGIEPEIIPDDTGTKANLFATVGPPDGEAGVIISGHSDVVSVAGQDWSSNPFKLVRKRDKLYARGAADMKGFVACAIAATCRATRTKLKSPLHFALSYDEELGCIGAGPFMDFLAEKKLNASYCIVGEPTSMAVAIGHKGKTALRALCRGRECHSSRAPNSVNAIHLACELIAVIRRKQKRLQSEGCRDDGYEIPYSTLHVGKIEGGTAVNIVPNLCVVDFELRSLAGEDTKGILDEIRAGADRIAKKSNFPEAMIEIEEGVSYPGLDTLPSSTAVRLAKELSDSSVLKKVDFGTEGGLFSQRLGLPTVICGPGSMDQGHGPDEYVEVSQLRKCDDMLDALTARLKAGQ